jgi:hypothetical protein
MDIETLLAERERTSATLRAIKTGAAELHIDASIASLQRHRPEALRHPVSVTARAS